MTYPSKAVVKTRRVAQAVAPAGFRVLQETELLQIAGGEDPPTTTTTTTTTTTSSGDPDQQPDPFPRG